MDCLMDSDQQSWGGQSFEALLFRKYSDFIFELSAFRIQPHAAANKENTHNHCFLFSALLFTAIFCSCLFSHMLILS